MSDNTANDHPPSTGRSTVADVLVGVEPMGDLSRFAIDDLSPEEEDEYFRIIEDA